MKSYIKYVADDYFEMITTSDDVDETTIPIGYKPLRLLDDGTNIHTDNLNYLKLIINDDVVYYKYLQKCSEISDNNVKIINLSDGSLLSFDLDAGFLTTELIQTAALNFLGADTKTIIQKWQNKDYNSEYRQKVSEILETQKTTDLITNNKEFVEEYIDMNLSADASKKVKEWLNKVSQPGYINTFLQNMYNKENGLPTQETNEAVATEEIASE